MAPLRRGSIPPNRNHESWLCFLSFIYLRHIRYDIILLVIPSS